MIVQYVLKLCMKLRTTWSIAYREYDFQYVNRHCGDIHVRMDFFPSCQLKIVHYTAATPTATTAAVRHLFSVNLLQTFIEQHLEGINELYEGVK